MKYCRRCVLPDTRPALSLDSEGICNACRAAASKDAIDWEERKKSFLKVADHARARSKGYDCLIPVSGGKDSHWQVATCLEHGLTPLAVTWKPPARTGLGQKNLDNLVRMGLDHIDFQVNPETEKKFMVKTFSRLGSTAVPMHLALFHIPLTLAVALGIPLVVWGENSAFEYGSLSEAHTGFRLDAEWLKHYGVAHGTAASDWIDDELTAKALTPYFGPSDLELERAGVTAVFLGYYFRWDPELTRGVAQARGFSADPNGPRTGWYDYADLDDDFISIHHWLKWYKFGFTRLFDHLSLEIRGGRLTREQALTIIADSGDPTPYQDIDRFCAFTEMNQKKFWAIAEKFRNPEIWEKGRGVWQIRDFIIDNWRWA